MQLIHAELHWHDIPEHKYKLDAITRLDLRRTAFQYMTTRCIPVSVTALRLHIILLLVINW